MNRELKFRIWDKNDTKSMIGPFSWNRLPNFDQPDNFIILQYTGLKDKNGKEIYEGDILMPDTFDGIWPEQRNGVLVKDIRQPFANAHLFKIVGNIFENPEPIKNNDHNNQ